MLPCDYKKVATNQKPTAKQYMVPAHIKPKIAEKIVSHEVEHILSEIHHEIGGKTTCELFKNKDTAKSIIKSAYEAVKEVLAGANVDDIVKKLRAHMQCDDNNRHGCQLLSLAALTPQPTTHAFSESHKRRWCTWNGHDMYTVLGEHFDVVKFAFWVLLSVGIEPDTVVECVWLLTIVAQVYGVEVAILITALSALTGKCPILFNQLFEALSYMAFLKSAWPPGTNPATFPFVHNLQRVMMPPF